MRRSPLARFTAVARTVTFVVLLVAAAAVPSRAQGVGAIGGNVTDSSGGALPGVTVTLLNAQGGIGGHQEAVTDGRGSYQFLRLVPGTYKVHAELQGFAPSEQTDIKVDADRTARADLRLQPGTVQQEVTVTAEAPLLDTSSAFRETVIDQKDLQDLPNRTDVWSISKIVPGLVYQNIDVGGSERFFQAIPSAHGTSAENKYMIDGMDVSSMNAKGTTAMMYPDPFAFGQSSVQLGAPTAEYSNGGITYNMVTRSGTNQFHGGGNFNSTTPNLARSTNYSAQLYAQLLSQIPAKVLAANPNLQPNADIRRMTDAGLWAGGPIIKDKLWYAGTWRDQRLDQFSPGNYDANGSEVEDNDAIWTTSGKLSWQALKSTQVSYFNNLQYHLQGHRNPGSGFYDTNATTYNYKYPDVNQVKVTSVLHSKTVLDVVYSRLRTKDVFNPQPTIASGAIPTFDSTTQVSGNAQPSYNINDHHRDALRGDITRVIGRHSLELGAEYQANSVATTVWSTSGLRANFSNGQPVSVNTYVVAITQANNGSAGNIQPEYTYVEHVGDVYVQDKWTPWRKLTMNLGLQYEQENSNQPKTCEPSNQFYSGGLCFEKVNAPSFNNLSPRFNLVYDLKGDGRTAIKLTANRYVQPIGSSVIALLNPLAGGSNAGLATVVSDTRQWLPQSRCGQTGVAGCDLNGDLLPELNEIGPAPGYVFAGVNASYAPGVRRPVSDEYSAQFQQQLFKDIVFTAAYVRTDQRNNIGQKNAAALPDTWIGPITVTEATSGQVVQVWKRGTTASAFLNYNDPALNLSYNGLDLTLNKRMSSHWSLNGGASFGRARVNSRGGNRSDPNIINSPYDSGLATSNEPWSYRVSGVYQLPYDFIVSGTEDYQVGAPETTTVLVTNQTISLPQGSQSVVVAPVGNVRLPNLSQLDMNVQRVFRLGRARKVTPRFEVFNLTNNDTIQSWVTQLGPAYHTPTKIQRGRLIKFELDFEF